MEQRGTISIGDRGTAGVQAAVSPARGSRAILDAQDRSGQGESEDRPIRLNMGVVNNLAVMYLIIC